MLSYRTLAASLIICVLITTSGTPMNRLHVNSANSCGEQPSFGSPRTFRAGILPQGVSVADFNEDGKPDIAVANGGGSTPNAGSISILLGDGDGSFSPPTDFQAGSGPYSVAIGDFNKDGHLDLAVANERSANISILLGDGKGNFGAPTNFSVGSYPRSIGVGDFNGDGNLDLAVVNDQSHNVSILLGDGSGDFATATNYSVGLYPGGIVVKDFNKDGKLDLAVGYDGVGDGGVSVLLGDGRGGFSQAKNFPTGNHSDSVASADFNGDGNLDLVVGNTDSDQPNSNSISVLLGDGTGNFSTATNFPAGINPYSIAVADLNGDGKLDLAVSNFVPNPTGNAVSILLGDGTGRFANPISLYKGDAAWSVAVGDFNLDGKPDLVTANTNSHDIVTFLNDGFGGFPVPPSFAVGNGPGSIVQGDFNKDGKLDVAVANRDSGDISILLGDGAGRFSPAVNYPSGTNPWSIAAGDFNGDGITDLVVANYGSLNGPAKDGSISVFIGDGTGKFRLATNFPTGTAPTFVAVGDFNADGKADLAVANFYSNTVSIWLGDGEGHFGPATDVYHGVYPWALAVGDFNNDGRDDIAVADNGSGGVAVLLNNGAGGFSVDAIYPTGQEPRWVAVSDFNNDGNADLAVANNFGNSVSILLGDGKGKFGPATNFPVKESPWSITVADFNGDGNYDLAIGTINTNDISILLGDGTGRFTTPYSYIAEGGPWTTVAGDFNGDGTIDLAAANINSASVSLLLNACPTAQQTLTIQGQVTINGSGLSGVTITLSGSSSGTATTDANGSYSFTVAAGGNYTITPTKTNYNFSPPNLQFTNLSTNRSAANFTATLQSFTISGHVVSGSTPLSGVTVTLSGSSSGIAATDSNGNYTFTVTAGGTYTITPAKSLYTFSPPSQTFTNVSGNQSAASFAATLQTFAISGQVTAGGTGLSGTTMTLSGTQSATTTTDASGNYTFSNLPATGNYTITPSKTNYTFSPANLPFNNLSANQTTANFTATLASYTISGQVTSGGTGLSGVSLTLSGSATGMTTTDANGNYSFTVAAGGNYTVTPSKTNYTFNPPSQTFTNISSNQTASPFAATLQTFTISGQVAIGGSGLSEVTIILSGSGSATTMTDTNGNFAFSNLPAGGNYTVTPSLANYTFTPSSQSFTLTGNQTAVNFTATVVPATLQLSAQSYTAGESDTDITVMVTRSGDPSASASVQYATSDGTATQKNDYIITQGTLHFAAGDTMKTIAVPVIHNGRGEGAVSATITLSNAVGATLGTPSTATLMITQSSTASATNPIDDPTFYVRQHYLDFLNREPDQAGLNFWVGQITSCNGDPQCIDIKRQNVSAAYFLSREFQETGFFAIKVQRAAFGHVSQDAAKRISYQQFIADSQQVGNGFIDGQTGADAILDQNKTAYVQVVVTSANFLSQYPNTMSASAFVDALFATAGVTPSSTERQDAITAFGSGDTAGRAAALRKVAETDSVKNAEFSPAFVLMQYFGYLRRNPTDPPDNNDNGYQFWLNKLTQFNGDYIGSQMVRSFIVSTEYRQRFGKP